MGGWEEGGEIPELIEPYHTVIKQIDRQKLNFVKVLHYVFSSSSVIFLM